LMCVAITKSRINQDIRLIRNYHDYDIWSLTINNSIKADDAKTFHLPTSRRRRRNFDILATFVHYD
jgi:hypothetical protein